MMTATQRMANDGASGHANATPALAQILGELRRRNEAVLAAMLSAEDDGCTRLGEAMRYATLGQGKRLRPCLVYLTGQCFKAPLAALDQPAAAVELIHAYSLVHDDLPAMDNDDLRRGQPTCHRAFDEATAILAGDALQALAFGALASGVTEAAQACSRVRMLQLLAGATGIGGMAGGQAIDLAAVGRPLDAAQLEAMHRRKTGALIEASVMLGAAAADVNEPQLLARLSSYGADVGLAFQIQDDILDVEGDTATLGKRTGADQALAKPTFPSVLGMAAARERARALADRASTTARTLGPDCEVLAELAHWLVQRRH
ncbi:MAG: polyprenyl synthetase family protein [Steroidobacteraceae bacterium]